MQNTVRSKGSERSIQSQGSIISEKSAIAAAVLAAKRAELKALNDQQQERARLHAELERLDAERAIVVRSAEVSAYDEQMGRDSHTENISLNPDATPYVPQTEILLAVKESLEYSRLPTCEPPIFRGDPLEFPRWKRSFESLIGHRNIRHSNKLALLEKYLKGEAAEAVSGMF